MSRIETSSRRSFLLRTGAALASGLALPGLVPILGFLRAEENGEEIFQQKMAWADRQNLAGQPLGSIIAEVGRSFLGAPYVAHSLEAPGREHLVVNLRAFDCVTFVESTLAISRCVRKNKKTFVDFTHELQMLRYRGGSIQGYPSRLHYFTDWIGDNERKGLVKNITGELGGLPVHKVFRIMSTHRTTYHQLENEQNYRAILAVEQRLSSRPYRVLPREHVAAAEAKIHDGDIIALATSLDGVDVTHTGFAAVSGGTVRFLHAPLSGGAVSISKISLSEYVGTPSSTLTGIIVTRPLEP